jgi:excisionase family DNA binding protein
MADYLKIPEVAQLLGLSEKTVRRRVKAGEIPSVFIGGVYRIPQADLNEYLKLARVRPGKVSAPLSQDRLFDGARERDAFLERVKEYVDTRVARYNKRLTEAEQGGLLASYEGARMLFDEALEEFIHLPDLINGELAERWMLDPQVPEEVKVDLGRAVGEIMLKPLVEIVERSGARQSELAETEAQRQEFERRKKEWIERKQKMRTRKLSA